MNRLKGKLALVTGASSGFGLATARRLAADGVHLILWARRGGRLEQAAADLTMAHHVDVGVSVVDVRDRAAVNAAAAALVVAGRIPDILINNAGLAAGLATVQDGDPDDWDRMIDTNLKGLLNVTHALLPHMIARRKGHIVNIGSTAGYWVYPKGNVYNATKFGVKALTEGLNLDLAGTPLRVSSVDPGMPRPSSRSCGFTATRPGPRSSTKASSRSAPMTWRMRSCTCSTCPNRSTSSISSSSPRRSATST